MKSGCSLYKGFMLLIHLLLVLSQVAYESRKFFDVFLKNALILFQEFRTSGFLLQSLDFSLQDEKLKYRGSFLLRAFLSRVFSSQCHFALRQSSFQSQNELSARSQPTPLIRHAILEKFEREHVLYQEKWVVSLSDVIEKDLKGAIFETIVAEVRQLVIFEKLSHPREACKKSRPCVWSTSWDHGTLRNREGIAKSFQKLGNFLLWVLIIKLNYDRRGEKFVLLSEVPM